MDLDHIKRIAIAAAYKGGEALRSRFGSVTDIRKKGAIDLVTEADTASERVIIQTLRHAFPDHAIMAEESGETAGDRDFLWVIDPLDGTTNFAHQVGLFAVSIAFAHQGRLVAGIVFNPLSGELFSAVDGQGASLNGRPIRVSPVATLGDSLLVTGFPYNFAESLPLLMTRFARCLKASQGVRRLGAAALDLCYVASGRFEAFWEENLKPWDTAAGVVIAREAGGTVTDFSNRPFTPEKPEILASNGWVHQAMIAQLEQKEAE
ncbi:MAG: inositol monophosphatase family protein [Desulfobacterales bacterium]|nr:inositol monophosphatase family protein [Desulfobacterales bacterium]